MFDQKGYWMINYRALPIDFGVFYLCSVKGIVSSPWNSRHRIADSNGMPTLTLSCYQCRLTQLLYGSNQTQQRHVQETSS